MSITRTYKPRLPTVAEQTIALQASLIGAVVHPVVDDQNGWDCLVEVPPIESLLTADLRPPGHSFLIQVKSKESAANACRLTLSNALKLARHPLACFVVMVTFEAGAENPSIYIRHIWGPLLEEILCAVRRADVESIALNHCEISIRFADADRFDDRALTAMVSSLDEIGENYATLKQNLINVAGFELGHGEGKFTLAPEVTIDSFVDFSLGLVDSVAISNFTYRNKRFGIVERIPSVELDSGWLTVSPEPAAQCVVMFRGDLSEERLSVKGEIYTPALADLPPEFQKLRIKTAICEMTLRHDECKFEESFDLNALLPFSVICTATAIRSLATRAPLNIEVWVKSRLLTQGRVEFEVEYSEFWQRLHSIIQSLRRLAPEEIWPSDLSFTLNDFIGKFAELRKFEVILNDRELIISFSNSEIKTLPTATHYRSPFYLEIRNFSFLVLIERPIMKCENLADRHRLSLGPPRILRSYILNGSAEENRKFISTELKAIPSRPDQATISFVPE